MVVWLSSSAWAWISGYTSESTEYVGLQNAKFGGRSSCQFGSASRIHECLSFPTHDLLRSVAVSGTVLHLVMLRMSVTIPLSNFVVTLTWPYELRTCIALDSLMDQTVNLDQPQFAQISGNAIWKGGELKERQLVLNVVGKWPFSYDIPSANSKKPETKMRPKGS